MSEDKKIEINLKLIKNYFKTKNNSEGWYSDYDEEIQIDYKIKYEANKFYLTKDDEDSYYSFNADVELNVHDIKIFDSENDVWITLYYEDDIPSWIWDNILIDIYDDFNNLFPHINMTAHFTFNNQ